jgi:hypothetical protein
MIRGRGHTRALRRFPPPIYISSFSNAQGLAVHNVGDAGFEHGRRLLSLALTLEVNQRSIAARAQPRLAILRRLNKVRLKVRCA